MIATFLGWYSPGKRQRYFLHPALVLCDPMWLLCRKEQLSEHKTYKENLFLLDFSSVGVGKLLILEWLRDGIQRICLLLVVTGSIQEYFYPVQHPSSSLVPDIQGARYEQGEVRFFSWFNVIKNWYGGTQQKLVCIWSACQTGMWSSCKFVAGKKMVFPFSHPFDHTLLPLQRLLYGCFAL